MSTIVSFDIGIKNLAYCILEAYTSFPASSPNATGLRPSALGSQSDVSTITHIRDWNVINLMTPPTVHDVDATSAATSSATSGASAVPTCTCMTKGKDKNKHTICGKPAKFQKEGIMYCGVHAKSAVTAGTSSGCFMMPKAAYMRSKLNARKKPELEAMAATAGLTLTPGTKSTYVDQLETWFRARCLEPIQDPNVRPMGAKDMDLITLGRHMCAHLDHIFGNTYPSLPITHVILENQISTLASRMKTIQGELTMYFLMKFPNAHIEYVSSTHKLRHFAGVLTEIPSETANLVLSRTNQTVSASSRPKQTVSALHKQTVDAKYRQHKHDAIRITRHLLEQNPVWSAQWQHTMAHKKKDDFADCFLQGLWYMSTLDTRS